MGFFGLYFYRILRRIIKPVVIDIINREKRIWGEPERIQIAKTASVMNALLNTVSGRITAGEYTFFGHNVSLITGNHTYTLQDKTERMLLVPQEGFDITIGSSVWIGTNVIVLGPCTIGDNAVIATGSLVRGDVPSNSVVGGIPAKLIKTINRSDA